MEKKITVKDVVRFEANIMGGVHAGSAKTENESALKEAGGLIKVFDERTTKPQLTMIGTIILRALSQLRKSITKKVKRIEA